MQPLNTFIKRFLCAALISAGVAASAAHGQQPAQTPAETPADDVLRITTELVQTDLMVFDKQGRFIDNLKPEQFELKVDGKPQAISFFERVVAGSTNEEAQLAAARGQARSPGPAAVEEAPARPLDRGRTIFFFIDDLHLTAESVSRVRKTLQNFIEKEMVQNDQVAITSASGQIGFLQQLTDNKTVLRKAISRIGFRDSTVRDNEPPPMTLYQALEIQNENREVLAFFIEAVMKDNPGLRVNMAESMIRARASRLVQPSNSVNTSVLASLSSLMQSTAQLPGRKLVFFISEGFLLNARDSDIMDRMRRVTDAAARSGTVVYTMDARGLETGMDATNPTAFDPRGQLPSAATEIRASQDPLQIIAASTGGRALLNSNSLDLGIRRTLEETSVYYLLAWRPDSEQQKSNKFRRIEARVIGRPELNVRMRNGYFTTPPETKRKNNESKSPADPVKAGEAELRTAINSVFPRRDVPTSLYAYYVDTPESGPLLTIVMGVAPEAVTLELKDGKQTGAVDVGGFVLNDEGKTGSTFKSQIQINAEPSRAPAVLKESLFYTSQVRIKPGLYQVRVAARDTKSGRSGSATQWIEIPDLSQRKLAMSNLMVGGRPSDAPAAPQDESNLKPVTISADRRFTRKSQLRFLTYIYNATPGPQNATPDIGIQVQVFRDAQPVLTTPMRQVKTEELPDMKRIPYAAEVPLENMQPGRYLLRVSVIDRITKTSASQEIDFEVL